MKNNTRNAEQSQEIWHEVLGYEGHYEVSNFGNVRSLARKSLNGRSLRQKMLRAAISGGYPFVNLRKDGKAETIRIHKLVANAFIGIQPDDYEVNHKDCDKLNNHVINLEYVTHKDNITHAVDAERFGFLSSDDVRNIRDSFPDMSLSELATKYNVGTRTISNILKRKTYTRVTKSNGEAHEPAKIEHGTPSDIVMQIKEQFHNRQCSVAEFAKKFSVHPTTIFNIVNGRRRKLVLAIS
jgi:Mor family transcriptional regulator